jgi:aminopeptidase N
MLAPSGEQDVFDQASRLYHKHESMTIKQQTLQLMHHHYPQQAEAILESFYNDWEEEDLVLDKWFSIQSCNPNDSAYDQVLGLLQHPNFTITNPNKVRSVLGRFAQANPCQFHHASGRGYELVAKYIIKLNKTNPQLAARLCSAFNGWRNISCEQRQEQMKAALKSILAVENLSADVFEIANKALILSAES